MNRVIIAILALVALSPVCANAQAICPEGAGDLPAQFSIRTTDAAQVTVDASKSARELNRLSKGLDTGTMLGLTEAAFGLRVNDTRDECGRKLVELELVLVKQTVYVASNIAPDSCTYRETLEHEMEHVALNSASLARIKDKLVRSFDTSRYSNDKELANAVQAELVGRAKKDLQDVRAVHVKFDQADRHASRSAECVRDLAAYASRS